MSIFQSPVLPFRYYLMVSIIMLVSFFFRVDITNWYNQISNNDILSSTLIINLNILLLLYIPFSYIVLYVLMKMSFKDNTKEKPDVLFMDPYEYWKLTGKK